MHARECGDLFLEQVITLLPGAVSAILFLFIVKNAALLKVGQVAPLLGNHAV